MSHLHDQKVRHLYRRAGFGPDRAQLRGVKLDEAIERLLRFPPRAADRMPLPDIPIGIVPTLMMLGDSARWWLGRMAHTPHPLQERLTLFWHRHFATSASKVFSPGLMLRQNQTLRQHCAGKFATMLKAMTTDPAMVAWLDLGQNNKDHPNENYARELLELFTVGRGNYTETDIQQLAKILTGYRTRFPSFKVVMEPEKRYQGPVRFLDLKGQLEPDRILEYLATHPATAERMVTKLWSEFASAPLASKVRQRLVEHWQKTRGHVLGVLRQMFLEPSFYAQAGLKVKSPVELYVSTLRLLQLPEARLKDVQTLNHMGECPFLPPSVKGWEQGEAWLHAGGLLDRFHLVSNLVERVPDNHELLTLLQRIPDRGRALQFGCPDLTVSDTLAGELKQADNPREALVMALCAPEFQFC